MVSGEAAKDSTVSGKVGKQMSKKISDIGPMQVDGKCFCCLKNFSRCHNDWLV